jgi:hypothetical protein
MKQTVWAMVLSAGFLALGYASMSSAGAQAAACGGKGQTPCPLQGWMEKQMDPAVEKGDTKALAAAFQQVAKFSPDPKWNTCDPNWAAISKAGADAAAKGDMAAAKAQCKSCHKAFRDKYKASFRTTPVPK